jgi:2-haloacid dehalogenase
MAALHAPGIDDSRTRAQACRMSRRQFLQLLPTLGAAALPVGAVTNCAAPGGRSPAASPLEAPRHAPIRAICFDLFTLFDPRSVVEVARSIVGDRAAELCEAWRTRQFEYSWLRAASGQYVNFEVVTDDALLFASRARKLTLTRADRRTLVGAYSRLVPWPDAREALSSWKRAGIRLAPLANYSPSMLDGLLANAGFTELFATQISTDAAKTFKPDPRAYALAEARLGLAREEIAFAAFGGWDAAGAKWFGFPTFWVNRLGVPQEELVAPDGTGPTLRELAEFVAGARSVP